MCETQGVPCLSTVVPWQAWYFGRQADPANPVPFKFTTMFFFGVEAFGGCFVPMWNRIPTNKVVGGMFPNDPDGNAFRDAWPAIIKDAGYTCVDGGAYTDGTTDYTSMISQVQVSKDCEIFINAPLPPGLQHVLEAGGPAGLQAEARHRGEGAAVPGGHRGARRPGQQHRHRPVVGPDHAVQVVADRRDGQELADAYQSDSGKQWLQTLGSTYSLFEVAQVALTAVERPARQEAVAAELQKVSYDGMSGPLDFTKGPRRPGIGDRSHPGRRPVEARARSYPWEMVVVDNSLNPDVPIGGDLVATNP